jgi:hypothetical protein
MPPIFGTIMKIDLSQASKILEKSQDEVMYMVQSNSLSAFIDDDTMSWQFELEDVLGAKEE